MLSLSDTPLNDSYRPVGTMHVVFGSVQKRQLAARKTLVFFETGKNSRLRGPRAAPEDAQSTDSSPTSLNSGRLKEALLSEQ